MSLKGYPSSPKHQAKESAEASKHFMFLSKETRDEYNEIKEEYEAIMKAVEETDDAEQFWKADTFIENCKKYFSYLMETEIEDTNWTMSNFYIRMRGLCAWATPKLGARLESISFRLPWELYKHIHYLAGTRSYRVLSHPKSYYGPEELSLLMKAVLAETSNTDFAYQMYVAFTMSFVFGPRAGSSIANKHYPRQYLRWEDIDFSIELPGRELRLRISLKCTKGRRDPCNQEALRQVLQCPTFNIYARNRAEDPHFDLTINLTILAIRRGRLNFENYAELEKWIANPESPAALPVNHNLDSVPVFLKPVAGKSGLSNMPLDSAAFNPSLQRYALKANILGVPPTLHSFRRETYFSLSRTRGRELARMKDHPAIANFAPKSMTKLRIFTLWFLHKDQQFQRIEAELTDLIWIFSNKYAVPVNGTENLPVLVAKVSELASVSERAELKEILKTRDGIREILCKQAARVFSMDTDNDLVGLGGSEWGWPLAIDYERMNDQEPFEGESAQDEVDAAFTELEKEAGKEVTEAEFDVLFCS
ncbi:hypothetical protein AA313_de0204511 [Arthrobotrys entomopaga]|nr:hypothetical protein AA313_de0204511 [Arthrobotrys entomopaga]